jgi:hypothetical protein
MRATTGAESASGAPSATSEKQKSTVTSGLVTRILTLSEREVRPPSVFQTVFIRLPVLSGAKNYAPRMAASKSGKISIAYGVVKSNVVKYLVVGQFGFPQTRFSIRIVE